MNQIDDDPADYDRNALEAFVVENEDLERLEALLGRFNIFEAIGAVRRELRHSDFLSFLLEPRGNHGLHASFIKRLLQRVIVTADDDSVSVTPIKLELWNLDQVEVRREWERVDVLVLDQEHELAVIIENKIDTREHSDQLGRYYRDVKQHYPDYQVIGLYLTPDGELPSHEAYLPVDYGLVSDVIEGLARSQSSVIGSDMQTLLNHYTEMLRRHIVGDSEIARLCQQIYRKHRHAIDLIIEHRPDSRAEMRSSLEDLVREETHLVLDESDNYYIRFIPRDWDQDALKVGEEWTDKWTKTGRMLLFQLLNRDTTIGINLTIGPGPEEVRQKLLDMALSNTEFSPRHQVLSRKWNTIYSRRFLKLGPGPYEEYSHQVVKEKLRQEWTKFLERDLPEIDAALKREEWIWETPEAGDP